MAIARSKLTAQGQISVPTQVRRKLGIGPGSVIEWDEKGGSIVVQRSGLYSSEDLHENVFTRKPKTRSLSDLKEGIRRNLRRRHARR